MRRAEVPLRLLSAWFLRLLPSLMTGASAVSSGGGGVAATVGAGASTTLGLLGLSNMPPKGCLLYGWGLGLSSFMSIPSR